MDGLARRLADHRFAELFREELGWDRSSGHVMVDIDGLGYVFDAIAQKRGLQVLHCTTDRRTLFNKGLLRRIQFKISKNVYEHILIYSCLQPPKQVWQWSIQMPDGRRTRYREHPFFSGSPSETLLERLQGLRFSLEEEDSVTFVDALQRVRQVLDVAPELTLFAKKPHYANRSDELAVAMLQGDKKAFDDFILLHRPLARHYSKRLQAQFGMDPEDAEQIGIIGLIKAARRFDPDRGIQFSTYAVHWIRHACQRYGPDAALFIRLPSYILVNFVPLHRELEKLGDEYGRTRVDDEIHRICSQDEGFYHRWLGFQRALGAGSVSCQGNGVEAEINNLLAPAEEEPIQIELAKERIERIRDALKILDKRQRRFLELYHGLRGRRRTLEEIARKAGITRERVRQINLNSTNKLRQYISREQSDLLPESARLDPHDPHPPETPRGPDLSVTTPDDRSID